jgi:hypothetical protein
VLDQGERRDLASVRISDQRVHLLICYGRHLKLVVPVLPF